MKSFCLNKKCQGSIMRVCRKCNNTNIILNGVWRQCANCGEVHERQSIMISTPALSSQESTSLNDIASLPLKLTLIGKLTSRFNLML